MAALIWIITHPRKRRTRKKQVKLPKPQPARMNIGWVLKTLRSFQLIQKARLYQHYRTRA